MGNRGILSPLRPLLAASAEFLKQLLSTWSKAKGKERDALLWGDEVAYLPLYGTDTSLADVLPDRVPRHLP